MTSSLRVTVDIEKATILTPHFPIETAIIKSPTQTKVNKAKLNYQNKSYLTSNKRF